MITVARGIEEVVWLDARGSDGKSWEPLEAIVCEPITMRTVGFVVKESVDSLMIAPSVCDAEGYVAHWLVVPKGMIVSRQRLTVNQEQVVDAPVPQRGAKWPTFGT